MKREWLLFLLLVAGCANGPNANWVQSPTPGVLLGGRPAPLMDHHQHLLSEGARRVTLDWTEGWPRDAVEIPENFQLLVAAREAAWSDGEALAGFLHERAVYLDAEGVWAIGRPSAAESLARTFGSAYHMRAVAWAVEADSGYIAGYYTRGVGLETRYVGYFHLDLIHTGGNWRILGETARFPGPRIEPLVDADQLVEMLDEAGIRKALVYSNAYYFARGANEESGEYDQVRLENDWTLDQVRRHPTRLLAACSVNPLRRYAVAEVERCASARAFSALKLHFNSSDVDLTNSAHLESVRTIYAAANRLRLPIVTHLQAETGFGAEQAQIFLREILPYAQDVPVTVNHLWGGGGYGDAASGALSAFADAFRRRDPVVANLWFDLAQVSMAARTDADRSEIVQHMREIGFGRLLYGSDGPQWGGVPPEQHWRDFQRQMPLSPEELHLIATNLAPHIRDQAIYED